MFLSFRFLRLGRPTALEGWAKAMKYVMTIINFASFVVGVVIIVTSFNILTGQIYLEQLFGTDMFKTAVFVLILLGTITIMVSFVGCIGAVKEIRCFLVTYCVLMFGILSGVILAGFIAYVFREKMTAVLSDRLYASVPNAFRTSTAGAAWDLAQTQFKCCGVEGPEGYLVWQERNRRFQTPFQTVPDSCCRLYENGTSMPCQPNPMKETTHLYGCIDKIEEVLQDAGSFLENVALGAAFVMVLSVIFSYGLFKSIHISYDRSIMQTNLSIKPR